VARNSRNVVWLVAACAALFAQVVPQAFCRDCDRGCCAAESRDCSQPAADHAVEPSGGCPLCTAAAADDACPSESDGQPCHCQLDARQDQPVMADSGPTHHPDHAGSVAILETVSLHVPRTLGVSREYMLASLAIPIRPPRILFGVWRN